MSFKYQYLFITAILSLFFIISPVIANDDNKMSEMDELLEILDKETVVATN